jgi:hypothetical protein
VHASLDAPLEQPGALEHAQVLGDGRQRHVERFRQLAHRGAPLREPLEDGAPRRIGEGRECGVQRDVPIVNHVVNLQGGPDPGKGKVACAQGRHSTSMSRSGRKSRASYTHARVRPRPAARNAWLKRVGRAPCGSVISKRATRSGRPQLDVVVTM